MAKTQQQLITNAFTLSTVSLKASVAEASIAALIVIIDALGVHIT